MVIIIGLGNPGIKFKDTRHNVGFSAVDKIAANFQFPILNFQSKSNTEISQGEINGEKVLLAKPQTFMNQSGAAVKKIFENCKLKIENCIVIHDDVDLPVGKIKIVKDRGSAGHKGVESIIKNIGNKNLIRIRIGIKPQSCGSDHRTAKAGDVVLKNFSKQEQKIIDQVLQKTVEALDLFVKEGLDRVMNEYNK